MSAGQDDAIDRLLRAEEIVEPSPAFVRRVMVAVHLAAERPEPLRFPWWQCLVALVSGAAVLTAGAVLILWSGTGTHLPVLPASAPRLEATLNAVGLTVTALAASWLLTWSAQRLVRR
jgi:hypothetical protein